MKHKMDEFTPQLALVDMIPVLAFAVATLLLFQQFQSGLFLAGAILCSVAGLLKVAWKLVLAFCHRDIPLLSLQLRVLMPLGFAFILASLFLHRNHISIPLIRAAVFSVPAVLFFAVAAVLLLCMCICAVALDRKSARANWVEQGINSLAQISVLMGIIFALQ